jgi:hypothetical protein
LHFFFFFVNVQWSTLFLLFRTDNNSTRGAY